jgi:hypothetical protein
MKTNLIILIFIFVSAFFVGCTVHAEEYIEEFIEWINTWTEEIKPLALEIWSTVDTTGEIDYRALDAKVFEMLGITELDG